MVDDDDDDEDEKKKKKRESRWSPDKLYSRTSEYSSTSVPQGDLHGGVMPQTMSGRNLSNLIPTQPTEY